ncbi:BON domain-containing protein [Pyxidicoccus fallax]|uniref:BON domain-containing protein n=1 Tax=Pyxidicoccus fallax TaxID=394095 RepID=A0A848L7B4_9BACT|nr:BON domain-containing protein [Pyxidicoccus fallax]NMO14417.1 BON domain-containing protein [Pyxidicoccus fallax]NPC77584.1 BON domain-containing protein [Pyxidicoccus fallax]
MNGRRDDDRGWRSGHDELRRGEQAEYQAGRRGDTGRDWDEHGYERGPERLAWGDRDARGADENLRKNQRGRELPNYGRGEDRTAAQGDWDEDIDYERPSRDFDRDRSYRTLGSDRDPRDYEMDRDFGRAARDMDRAREPGRDFNRDRELDRRARDLDPERISRQPGYSPSGSFRSFQEEIREERERPRRYGDRSRPSSLPYDTDRWGHGQYALGEGADYQQGGGRDSQRYGGDAGRGGQDRGRYGFGTRGPSTETRGDPRRPVGRDFSFSERGVRGGTGRVPDEDTGYRGGRDVRGAGRTAEDDTRFGGSVPGGHGPGVENMAPPRVGYGTSPSRRDDHEMGHGGYLGGTYRSATPTRLETPTRPVSPGRGPRSYQRGDDRIRADICDRLMQGWMNAEDVEVMVKDGDVTLSGTVRGRDEKRAIEDLAEEVLGVKNVTNNIRINRAEAAQHRPSSQEPVSQPGADTGDDRTLHS